MSYRLLAGRVHGYTPKEGYNSIGNYYVQGSNGARTVRTTMPRSRFLRMDPADRTAWLQGARRWVERQLT